MTTKFQNVFAAVVLSVLLTALIFYAANAHDEYGYGAFVIAPFFIGCLSVCFVRYFQWDTRMGRWAYATAAVITLSALVICGLILLLLGLEGLICLIIAFPIVIPAALLGVLALYVVHRYVRVRARDLRPLLLLSMACACLMGAEQFVESKPPIYRISTSVIVDAPIEAVWDVVIDFPELPPPTEWMFQTGIAYPIRARMEGEGVGATRYCEFSTGPFIEPITTWEAPHHLAFDVAQNPAPMVEWNPFHQKIDPPHLHGFMESERGEFRLESLSDGRTRLTGNTWYAHGLWPAWYWRLWSDHIIHTIHQRVLNHVKTIAEAESLPRPTSLGPLGPIGPISPPRAPQSKRSALS